MLLECWKSWIRPWRTVCRLKRKSQSICG
jgi:hypothetical protein